MDERALEALQKRARRSFWFAAAFSAAVFLTISSVLLFLLLTTPDGRVYLEESPAEMITGVTVLPALLAAGIYFFLHQLFVKGVYATFDQAFKRTYVLQTVEAEGGFSNLSYTPEGGFGYEEIRDSLVVNCGEYKYFKSEDRLAGKLYAMPFSYSDVVTRYFRRNGKKSELRTIFSGQVMRFTLPEDCKWSFGHLQIFEKELFSNLKGRTAPYKIQTENEAFNRRFEIFAADEHNAFYLLTPRMLEQITRFADYANCQIALTFVGMSLYVAVDRPHSMFNASVRQSLAKQRQLILNDAILLQKAGEILVLGADALTGSSYG